MAAKTSEPQTAHTFPESSFKYNPLMHVRVLFVRFVQGLFASAPEGSYRWTPDVENTEIYISDEESIKPEVVEKIPAVSFTRGIVQFHGLGLDDLHDYNFALNRKTKGVLLPGTMTVNCCSRVPLESEHIAFVIADHIWLLRDLLMQQGFFEVGRGIQVGSPSPAGSIIANDSGDEYTCTPVSVPYQFSRLSSYTPIGLDVIQSIEQHIHARLPLPVGPKGVPLQGHEVPVNYCYSRPPKITDGQVASLKLQPHPLNPSQQVRVRVVRGNSAQSRLLGSRGAIPISRTCVEQSSVPGTIIEQKG